jgi:hypothetical protein
MPEIYHIIHIRNLSLILQHGCLWSDNERIVRQLNIRGIAHQHIKDRRARRDVPACNGGFLADYVPFYFAPRSPMLYTISRGNVEGYTKGQSPILHLVSSVESVVENDLPFTFTNGHAEMALCDFYDSIDDLQNVDWDLMKSKYWNDTDADSNRKFRRQAEFLVHNHFPINLVNEIGVIRSEIGQEVEQILTENGHQINVTIRPNWYY